jgi:hypothetical protein
MRIAYNNYIDVQRSNKILGQEKKKTKQMTRRELKMGVQRFDI